MSKPTSANNDKVNSSTNVNPIIGDKPTTATDDRKIVYQKKISNGKFFKLLMC